MSYVIRFEGIGSTTVRARDPREAIQHAELFERLGKIDIVLGVPDGHRVPLNEFRKRHES